LSASGHGAKLFQQWIIHLDPQMYLNPQMSRMQETMKPQPLDFTGVGNFFGPQGITLAEKTVDNCTQKLSGFMSKSRPTREGTGLEITS
jgi:hypothetical protein